jgi:hypothetical protein
MTRTLVATSMLALIVVGAAAHVSAGAQGGPGKVDGQQPASDKRPDLSGTWSTFPGVNAGAGLRRETAGTQELRTLDAAAMRGVRQQVPGAKPSTDVPSYKPEFQAKVRDLEARQSRTDPVFYCGKPGVPRVGPPRRIIQLPNEVVFFYEDMSGDPYRIIPTDGRPHRADANPSYYGDSVGHWEGNTLVIDVRNFVEDSWFGEKGYFHTDAMRVTERLWRQGENLVWQATVEDPNVLTAPWTMAPRMIRPSTQPLEESPPCREQDGALLRNDDHHDQR